MGKLDYKNKKFYFNSSDDHEDRWAMDAGFRFDSLTLEWTTRNIEKAWHLRKFANSNAKSIFRKNFRSPYELPEEIIYPDHLSPHTFQIESAWHCLAGSPAYCADEAGLGKTITASLLLNTIQGHALVICPPFAKYNWLDELNAWSVERGYNHEGVVIFGKHRDISQLFNAHTLIVPDSIIHTPAVIAFLKMIKFKWLIVDEAHRFSHEETRRTQLLLDSIVDLAERTVYMSGTPLLGKPMNLHPILSKTAPWVINHMSRDEFGEEFCDARDVKREEWKGGQMKTITHRDYSGASNLEEFNELLFDKFMIRHLKREVLPELPPKTRQLIFLDKPSKIEKYEKKVLAHHTIEDLLNKDTFKLGDVATYRQELGVSKTKQAIEFLSDLLETVDSRAIIIFAIHIDVVKALAVGLKRFDPIVVRGDISAEEKQKRINAFKKDKRERPIIANIGSMGVNQTLTRAKRGVFVEWDWTFDLCEQAEDRIHRLTQTENVLWQYLVLRNSLDERMLRSAMKQKEVTEVALNRRKERNGK